MLIKRLYNYRFRFPVAAFLILSGFVLLTSLRSDQSPREKILLETVMRAMNAMHFDPLPVNDTYSQKVFDNYLKTTDLFRKFFTHADIASLEIYKNDIDNQINAGEFEFFNAANDLYFKRLEEASAYYQQALEKPMDFTVKEMVELDPDKTPWCATEADLREEWRKAVKYQVMIRIHQDLEIQEAAEKKKDTLVTPKSYAEIETGAISQVKKMYDDYFERLRKGTRADRFEDYLNAITTIYDPHSNYMAPAKKENFDISMTGKLEGIGAVLAQRNGLIQVEEIMPGSPSWKQGDLKAGDMILKVAQGEAEPVDVTNMRLDEAVRLVRGKKGTEVRLTVKKKATDDIVVISIIRDVVEMEQTFARSAILNTPDGKKLGYLYLPRFYADFSNPFTGRFCANDVRKEIEKLKSLGIDALMFDLRNNGGGSLSDVVKIAGFFFELGPVVQVKDKIEGLNVLNDIDPRIDYDGPVVVMVNTGSASASEIFASAMQDYKRAVIIGSPTTFGKGTVQRLYELDQMLATAPEGVKPMGTLKLTTQKFYRINGGATQLKGVIPDIVLPDPWMYLETGERDLDNPMAWTQIKPAGYTVWKGPYGDVASLRAGSEKRTRNAETFMEAEKYAKELKSQRDQTLETLNLADYRAKQKTRKERSEQMEKLMEKETGLAISLTPADQTIASGDTIKGKLLNEWIGDLKKDVYLSEAAAITRDLLSPQPVEKSRNKRK
ncbi:MAG TPA: carboxy terminal-processing peptidase [Bacteroidales bacterium]|nr:carboxy terminal-processing peptidase [Bacteroidales bacterium]HRZ48098.1 carboxy terminal-processing peptidase [Bacteroidales bacterium]